MDYYNYTKVLPKPVTIAIMIPLVMLFLFIIVPIVLVFATIVFTYSYIKKKKYRQNPHYQEFDKSILSKLKAIYGNTMPAKSKPSEEVIDIECRQVEKEKLDK